MSFLVQDTKLKMYFTGKQNISKYHNRATSLEMKMHISLEVYLKFTLQNKQAVLLNSKDSFVQLVADLL